MFISVLSNLSWNWLLDTFSVSVVESLDCVLLAARDCTLTEHCHEDFPGFQLAIAVTISSISCPHLTLDG